MAELVELIKTTRRIGVRDDAEPAAHKHIQFFSKDGELIVEKCPLEDECDYTQRKRWGRFS